MTLETPREITNRSGLPQVSYRPGGYAEFRASLHALLDDEGGLPKLTTRDSDDFTIGLLDGVACVAEVLTFYSERLINESYLGTALDRTSLAELGKLVGYRLRPGVAATTHLAFHVEPPPRQQLTDATSPFQRVRMPAEVIIEAGTAVRSVPGPGEQQQTFETAQRLVARPEWNMLRPLAFRKTVLGAGATSMNLRGVATGLRAGDQLLFAADLGTWAAATVATVTPSTESTLVTWKPALGVAGPLTPYVWRKRLAVFGHQAPMWGSMSDTFRKDYKNAVESSLPVMKAPGKEYKAAIKENWPFYAIRPASAGQAVDIEGSHPEIAVGSWLMLVQGNERGLFEVAEVEELTRSEFAVSGKVTRAHLTGNPTQFNKFISYVRETTIFAVNDPLDLVGEPDPTAVAEGQCTVAGDVSALPPGRLVLVSSPAGAQLLAVASAVATDEGTELTFAEDLAQPHDRAKVSIFGNVAVATHGETVHQILGDGSARPFQRFELKHAPLTYVPADGPSGAQSTLEVRVNEVRWAEVGSHYPAGPNDRTFVTREAPGGEVVVGTGDGARGARVPAGSHNVRAKYRKGTGEAGNLPTGALTQLASPPLGVTGVTNPVPAQGGADPDTVAQARTGIPRSTRTLGRAVSLTDYGDYASTFAGVAKADVTVLAVRNTRTIVVTVASAEKDHLAGDLLCARLAASLRSYGDPLAPVLVVPHRPAWFQVAAKVLADPALEWEPVRKAIAARLEEAFGFGARDFGMPVRKSEVIAVIHRAPGVIAVDLDVLARYTAPAPPELDAATGLRKLFQTRSAALGLHGLNAATTSTGLRKLLQTRDTALGLHELSGTTTGLSELLDIAIGSHELRAPGTTTGLSELFDIAIGSHELHGVGGLRRPLRPRPAPLGVQELLLAARAEAEQGTVLGAELLLLNPLSPNAIGKMP
ncbi:putative baseplate assembly protein [Rhizocola hellebori]|uniref:Putative baseplate assembly protein n=1 Tax=Rhizocola hellebori TaxID=1392758 RepID=A0A8J3QBK5_9ACTN|nr:baseplate J/gp47 family protein [Rhizocola hellebori]GIH06857.1 putative baseplate assembly protein [Rhizocola hellebori]